MTKNVYIHIPFCKSKCNYCSFISVNKFELKDEYIKAIVSQINSSYKGEVLNTLYFGGGTPSTLTIDDFKKLISLFKTDENTEITAEINPEGIEKFYLKGLKELGINRISIGSQTFDDEILTIIGRRHSSKHIEHAVKLAKEVGFKNISLDFIYGLPTQSIKSFESDLEQAINLGIQHVSLYGLKIDEGCSFYTNKPLNLPDGDEQADMYLLAIKKLTENGFKQYEISNFALPSFESKHNLNYWDNNPYYGFGLAASGYEDGIRYTNEDGLEKYIENPMSKIFKQKLSKKEIMEEEIFLGFRKADGIDFKKINKKFEIDFEKEFETTLKKYISTGHLKKTQTGYALSTEGFLLSNEILAEFIEI